MKHIDKCLWNYFTPFYGASYDLFYAYLRRAPIAFYL